MFNNSIIPQDRPLSETIQIMEQHKEAITRYNAFFRDSPSTSALVDYRFQHLSQIINNDKDTLQSIFNQSQTLQGNSQTTNQFPNHLNDQFFSQHGYFTQQK